MESPIHKYYWIEEGQLLAGEYPRNLDEASSLEKIAALKDLGVTLFVDLTEEGELFPYAQWAAPAKHVRFPIPDHHPPVTPEQAAAILDAIDECIASGGIACVHCMGGVGRTGTVIGCWLARRLGSGDGALERLCQLWPNNAKSHERCRSPDRCVQRDYVREWLDNAPRGAGERAGR